MIFKNLLSKKAEFWLDLANFNDKDLKIMSGLSDLAQIPVDLPNLKTIYQEVYDSLEEIQADSITEEKGKELKKTIENITKNLIDDLCEIFVERFAFDFDHEGTPSCEITLERVNQDFRNVIKKCSAEEVFFHESLPEILDQWLQISSYYFKCNTHSKKELDVKIEYKKKLFRFLIRFLNQIPKQEDRSKRSLIKDVIYCASQIFSKDKRLKKKIHLRKEKKTRLGFDEAKIAMEPIYSNFTIHFNEAFKLLAKIVKNTEESFVIERKVFEEVRGKFFIHKGAIITEEDMSALAETLKILLLIDVNTAKYRFSSGEQTVNEAVLELIRGSKQFLHFLTKRNSNFLQKFLKMALEILTSLVESSKEEKEVEFEMLLFTNYLESISENHLDLCTPEIDQICKQFNQLAPKFPKDLHARVSDTLEELFPEWKNKVEDEDWERMDNPIFIY